jgi:hypothetical protein
MGEIFQIGEAWRGRFCELGRTQLRFVSADAAEFEIGLGGNTGVSVLHRIETGAAACKRYSKSCELFRLVRIACDADGQAMFSSIPGSWRLTSNATRSSAPAGVPSVGLPLALGRHLSLGCQICSAFADLPGLGLNRWVDRGLLHSSGWSCISIGLVIRGLKPGRRLTARFGSVGDLVEGSM